MYDGDFQVILNVNLIIEVRMKVVILCPLDNPVVILASVNNVSGGLHHVVPRVPVPDVCGNIRVASQRLTDSVKAMASMRRLEEGPLEVSEILL